jgi:hypothetical protein
MARVVVVHFNPPNLAKRIARLTAHEVEPLTPKGPDDLKRLRERPPDAFVVDLDRRPSEGRSIAVQLRRKVAAIDQTWSGLRFARKKP